MLGKRILSAAVIIPVVIGAAIIGSWAITAVVILLAGVSAWEFWRMFKSGGYAPSLVLTVGGAVGIIAIRTFLNDQIVAAFCGLLLISAISWHTLKYQRGIPSSAVDFCVTIGGAMYLGFLGSYIVSLRGIPGSGLWWLLLALFSIGFADAAAYFIGRAIGKHKMMPRVSPNKSWEGYLGGILAACLLVSVAALCMQPYAPGITWWKGGLLALVVATLAPMGDFGESMLKRQFNIKDSSNLIPGHGGAFDRIDSYLFAGFLAYYVITLFFK